MPTRPPREPFNALVLAALAVVVTAVLIAAGGHSGGVTPTGEPSWQGLAGSLRPRVAVGQRVIVVLKAPALADRVGRAGGLATSEDERRWTHTALSSQKLLVARLRVQGVVVQPEFSYTRTVNGFSAAFDPRGIALVERAADVAGVYPVRAAYPASLSSRLLTTSEFGERPNIGLSDKSVQGLAEQAGDERFAWDSYRRLIQMFGKTVLGVEGDLFEDALEAAKAAKKVTVDTELGSAHPGEGRTRRQDAPHPGGPCPEASRRRAHPGLLAPGPGA